MRLAVRPIETWPEPPTTNRRMSPFKASWSDTVTLLEREADALGAGELVVQLAVTEADIRLDGWIRATARPTHPGVIVSFDSKHGPLRYSTDRFLGWQSNVRAIALGLEALRKVDRYGIGQGGEQYRGWQALPPGTPMPAAKMTIEEAALFVLEHGRPDAPRDEHFYDVVQQLADRAGTDDQYRSELIRSAAKRLHPDAGGDPDLFRRLTEARDLLLGAG